MADDVVAELDAWLDRNPMTDRVLTLAALVQRARDEIVALRETVERQRLVLSKGHAETRDEALEEAARICEGPYTAGSTASTLTAIAIAKAIRALKEKA